MMQPYLFDSEFSFLQNDINTDLCHLFLQYLFFLRQDCVQYGSLWSKLKANDVVRVNPAVTLHQILTDDRFIVRNFLVTFQLFTEHQSFIVPFHS